VCLVCACVFYLFLKVMKRILFYLSREKKKEKNIREKGKVVGP